jgi:hypothetical protein
VHSFFFNAPVTNEQSRIGQKTMSETTEFFTEGDGNHTKFIIIDWRQ